MIKEIFFPEDFPVINGKQTSLKDDPVRPELDFAFRTSQFRHIIHNNKAIVCYAYCTDIPTTIQEMSNASLFWSRPRSDWTYETVPSHIVFYTIWSYVKGGARELINEVVHELKEEFKNHDVNYVTLSPKTEMAMKFHLNNGASLLSENETSNNFLYP